MAYSLFHNSLPFLRVHVHWKALRNFEKSLFSRIKKLSTHYLLKSSKGIPNNFVEKTNISTKCTLPFFLSSSLVYYNSILGLSAHNL